jgi:hypothetical protein
VASGRIIPIKPVGAAGAVADDADARLRRAGFMRMMDIGEGRLLEFVALFEARGYEVEVVRDAVDAPAEPAWDAGTDTVEASDPAGGTIYVRKRKPPSD